VKMNKRAVLDLPIRIVVVLAVLAAALPFIGSAMEYNEEATTAAALENQIGRITNAAAVVYFSGEGSCRTVDLDIPSGCSISVGGKGGEAYSVRGIMGDRVVYTGYMDKPSVGFSDETMLSGKCTVLVRCSEGGNGYPVIQVIA